jgi:CubicO group peptidase (beta-lactamase class C family)
MHLRQTRRAIGRKPSVTRFFTFLVLAMLLAPLPTPVDAREIGTIAPRKAGFSADRLERIPAHFQTYIDQQKVTGFVTLVARNGKIVDRQVMGMMDLETARPMREDAIFRIYSMSKPVAAVALMMLHEQGLFRLGDPVSKFIPELGGMKVFVAEREGGLELEEVTHDPTIAEVLSHTAGFGYGLVPIHPVEKLYAEAKVSDPKTTLANMMTKIANMPLRFQPGTSWSYSVGNDIQGRLVEVISGLPFDRYLDERLFGPLDMRDSGFIVPIDDTDRLTTNYQVGPEGGMTAIDRPSDSIYVEGHGKRLFSGGGGLVSTARDYLRFAQMLVNGGELDGVRILSRKTIGLMTTDHLPAGIDMRIAGRAMFPGIVYGFGFGIHADRAASGQTASVGAFWWGGAANTHFWVDPVEKIVGVIMTQRFPGDQPFGPDLQTLTYQALDD